MEAIRSGDAYSGSVKRAGALLDAGAIYQLVYFSTSLVAPLDAGGRRAIRDILTIAQDRNRQKNITGALTYNEMNFAQVLEGGRREVEDVFSRVKRDRRHLRIVVIEEGWVKRRDFAAWAMAYVGDGNSLRIISPNTRLADLIAGQTSNAAALIQMMKFLLQDALPRD